MTYLPSQVLILFAAIGEETQIEAMAALMMSSRLSN